MLVLRLLCSCKKKNKSLLERNFQNILEYMLYLYIIFHKFSANISQPLLILSHQQCQLLKHVTHATYARTTPMPLTVAQISKFNF